MRLGKIVNYISWLLTFCVCDLTMERKNCIRVCAYVYGKHLIRFYTRNRAHYTRKKTAQDMRTTLINNALGAGVHVAAAAAAVQHRDM